MVEKLWKAAAIWFGFLSVLWRELASLIEILAQGQMPGGFSSLQLCCKIQGRVLIKQSFICLFLISQAGWWFNYCYYSLLTATSVGPESTYESSPYLVWQLGAYAYGTSWRNWYKYSQAKFTLKLK